MDFGINVATFHPYCKNDALLHIESVTLTAAFTGMIQPADIIRDVTLTIAAGSVKIDMPSPAISECL